MRDFRIFPFWWRYLFANLLGTGIALFLYWRRLAGGQDLALTAPLAVIGVWLAGTTVTYVLWPVGHARWRRWRNARQRRSQGPSDPDR